MTTYERNLAYFSREKNSIISVSQYGGEIHDDGDITFNYLRHKAGNCLDIPLSHQFYRATDFTTGGYLYAPFDMVCIYHGKYIENEEGSKLATFIDMTDPDNPISYTHEITTYDCIISIFESVELIKCADGEDRKLTPIMLHGADRFTPVVGQLYPKDSKCYYQGIQGMPAGATEELDSHIHLEILPYEVSKLEEQNDGTVKRVLDKEEFSKYTTMCFQKDSWNYFVFAINPDYSLNFHEVFFDDENFGFTSIAAVKNLWLNEDRSEKAYYLFDHTVDKPRHGFVDLGNSTYFYDLGQAITGWVYGLDGNWYFFDYTTSIMKTGWATIDGENYYFNDNGVLQTSCWIYDGTVPMYYVDSTGMRVKGWLQLAYPGSTTVYWFYFNDPDDYNISTLSVGQKASDRWIASGSDWYYVNPQGKMLTNSWVASGSDWYYVKADGKMAYSESITLSDGGTYHFNASGVCTNPYDPD